MVMDILGLNIFSINKYSININLNGYGYTWTEYIQYQQDYHIVWTIKFVNLFYLSPCFLSGEYQ